MKKLFHHWWQACLLGLLVGIPTGVAFEFVRRAHNEAATEAMAREFELKGHVASADDRLLTTLGRSHSYGYYLFAGCSINLCGCCSRPPRS